MSELRLRGGPLWEDNEVFFVGDQRVVLETTMTLDAAIALFGPVRVVHRIRRDDQRETQEGVRRE